MLKQLAGVFLLALCLEASAAGVGVRAGTMGVGGDIGWSIAPTLSARVGYSGLNLSRDVTTDGVRYDGRLRLRNLSALADFSPLGPFRLTAGAVFANNAYSMQGSPNGGTWNVGGRTYNASDVASLSGEVTPRRRIAPYLGIGYGNVAGAGVNFYADLGVILQGAPRARLTATCGATLNAAQCQQLQSDVAEEQRRLEDRLNSFRAYPVLNLGLTVGF